MTDNNIQILSEGSDDPSDFPVKRPNTGLKEREERKRLQEATVLRKVLKQRIDQEEAAAAAKGASPPLAVPPPIGAPPAIVEDAQYMPPPIRIKTPVASPPLQATIAHTPANEGEPSHLNWQLTSVEEIIRLAAAMGVISDVGQMAMAAHKQVDMPFGLIKGHGTAMLIKTDMGGNFYWTPPCSDPRCFANTKLTPDGDVDEPGSPENPKMANPIGRTHPAGLLSTNTAGTPAVFEELDRHILDVLTERHDALANLDRINPQRRDVVKELLQAASDIRAGRPTAENKEDPLPNSVTPVRSLVESKGIRVSIKEATRMLYEIQSQLKKKASNVNEAKADLLSDLIAEALLTDKKSIVLTEQAR